MGCLLHLCLYTFGTAWCVSLPFWRSVYSVVFLNVWNSRLFRLSFFFVACVRSLGTVCFVCFCPLLTWCLSCGVCLQNRFIFSLLPVSFLSIWWCVLVFFFYFGLVFPFSGVAILCELYGHPRILNELTKKRETIDYLQWPLRWLTGLSRVLLLFAKQKYCCSVSQPHKAP